MAIILDNFLLVDIDPVSISNESLRIENGTIVERGKSVTRNSGDETVDGGGAVLLPGLVNGHTHLYSALAPGMPAPPKQPRNFPEILEYIWWRLDRALDEKSIRASGLVGALDAVRCGTTTLIDHHASPNCIDRSLDLIEEGIASVGLRAVLCYEVTDRNGPQGRDAGLEENLRYCTKTSQGGQFAGMVGGHASFTLENETLMAIDEMSRDLERGVHIHVAEDPCDERHSMEKHDLFLIDRLDKYGLLRPANLFAHGTHLRKDQFTRLCEANVSIAHNPRSNMNNGVGYTPIGQVPCSVQLGTDGIGGDMFTEAKAAWFKACDAHQNIGPDRIVEMLAASARRASFALKVTVGKLQPGAQADIVLTDYHPATPLTAQNFPGHFIFAMGSHHVDSVMVNGKWVLRSRKTTLLDEVEARAGCVTIAKALWERMG